MSVDVLAAVRTSIARLLRKEAMDADGDANLFDLGLDSISVIELVSILREDYGFTLSAREAFENSSINGLANAIASHLGKGRRRSG